MYHLITLSACVLTQRFLNFFYYYYYYYYFYYLLLTDDNGRYIILDITIEIFYLSIVNLYGPNSDNPYFFQNLQHLLENLPGSIIMA